MYITRRQSQIVAVSTLVLFFVVGIWFTTPANRGSQPKEPTPPKTTVAANTPEPSITTDTEQDSKTEQAATTEESTPPETPTETAPEAARFTLEEFHRSETRDGKLLWEIFGKNARYIAETNSVAIDDCKLTFFAQDEKQIDLRSGTALVFLDGPELSKAELRDGVTLVYDETITVNTTDADFDRSENVITSDSFVTISGGWYDFEGTGLHADLDAEQLKLKTDVESNFNPARRPT